MKKALFSLIFLISTSLLIAASVYAYPNGVTGYSSDGCGPCHGSTPGANTTVTISGLPGAYEPMESYSLMVIVTSSVNSSEGGFDLSVTNGTLVVTDSVSTKLDGGELTNTDAGKAQRSWTFNWTAPSGGDVTFDVAGLASDAQGDVGGDEWALYSTTFTIIPEFPGFTILVVLSAVTILIVFLTRKRSQKLQ